MFPVVLGGLALTVATLGVYRFWYMTHVRRFLWNNVEVDGDYVEYTGRGVELFIGFLIALAVLAPLYGAIFLIGFLAGPYGAIFVNAAAAFGAVAFGQYALFRARRYRLTRTVWRGVRFQQTGSGWSYAWRSLAWALVAIATLGLAYPWMRASLERYKMSHTWYGDQKGAFSGTGGALFRRGILLWAVLAVTVALPVAAALHASGLATIDEKGAAMAAGSAAIGAALLAAAFVIPLYQAVEYRWWAQNCSVGPATARCDLGLFAFFKVYLGYVGIALLFSIAVGLLGAAVALAIGVPETLETQDFDVSQVAMALLATAAYFVVGLVFAALWQVFAVRPMWRKSLESVEIVGLAALTAAQSAVPEANAFGEGVADALDFGGF